MTKTSATHSLPIAKAIAFAGAAALLPALPVQAQEVVTDETPSVRDVAMTPLTDLNLSKDPIPQVLLTALEAPYEQRGISGCGDIRREVANLDAVLGDDLDTTEAEGHRLTATGVARSVVGSFIPFRGIIREISGANDHERDFREAIVGGMMRRAYLKGKGQELGCAYPASPATPELVARLRAQENGTVASAPITPAVASGGPQFVSRPVVQRTD